MRNSRRAEFGSRMGHHARPRVFAENDSKARSRAIIFRFKLKVFPSIVRSWLFGDSQSGRRLRRRQSRIHIKPFESSGWSVFFLRLAEKKRTPGWKIVRAMGAAFSRDGLGRIDVSRTFRDLHRAVGQGLGRTKKIKRLKGRLCTSSRRFGAGGTQVSPIRYERGF